MSADRIQGDSETRAEGAQVLTACGFIHRAIDGIPHVFLAKRADTKRFLPGVYELPGGHIDFGESMETGLKREIKEEFGLSVRVGDPFGVFTYVNEIKGSHSIEVVYFAHFDGDDLEPALNPADHSSCGWYSEADIDIVAVGGKSLDDPEFAVIRKGFALLGGEALDMATRERY